MTAQQPGMAVRADSEVRDIPLCVGRIMTNLQSLEFAIRLFLDSAVGPRDPDLRLRDLHEGELVAESHFTNYGSLRDVAKQMNRRLEELGITERVDESLVDIRDALAHGRVIAFEENGPYRLLEFSRSRRGSGQVEVKVAVDVTRGWLNEQIRRTADELYKVMKLCRSIGLDCE